MKEAAGEANLTVVAIILIAVVVAVATPLVTSLMRSSSCRSCCTDAGGVWRENQCQEGSVSGTGHFDEDAYQQCATDAGAENCR